MYFFSCKERAGAKCCIVCQPSAIIFVEATKTQYVKLLKPTVLPPAVGNIFLALQSGKSKTMQIKTLSPLLFSAALLSLASCGGSSSTSDLSSDSTVVDGSAQAALTIVPMNGSPEFPDARLSIKQVKAVPQGEDSVQVTIDYDVKNYELKNQTSDAESKNCNNSKDGQHIHFILDNAPYVALYEPTRTFTVAKNSEHYLMSFLSRSYHESVKSEGAAVLYRFAIDEKGNLKKLEPEQKPMVFYSRPKGDYLGDDTQNVLLDFYIYNATLGKDVRLKADINGTTFDIEQWQPYFIQNAPMGDLQVNLQLTDMNGNKLEGPHTSVSRTAKLAQQEPVR
jgi:hypothetical protein